MKNPWAFPPSSPWRSGAATDEDLDLIGDAIQTARPSISDLAEGAGTTQASFMAYRTGRARMPEEVRLRFAADLMARARRLERLAVALSDSADPAEGEE